MTDSTRDSTKSSIDLGDDLLVDSTREFEQAFNSASEARPSGVASSLSSSIDERFSSARIFFNEGILEECKRLLHQIVMEQPDHLPSRELLEQIHELELKQIFGSDQSSYSPRRKPSGAAVDLNLLRELDPRRIDTDEIVARLDRELELGISDARPSLIAEKSQLDGVVRGVEASLAGAAAGEQDRLDISVGFIEMGMPEVAARLLRPLLHSESSAIRVSATALAAFSLIAAQQAFEATLILQPSLQETELPEAQRAELLYLMGRAAEAQCKPQEALGWYAELGALVPRYRDVEDRMVRLR